MTWSKLILHHVNLSALATGINDTSSSAQGQGDEFNPNTSEIGLVAKDETKSDGVHRIFFRIKGKLQTQNVLTESEGLTRYANCVLDQWFSTIVSLRTPWKILFVSRTPLHCHLIYNFQNTGHKLVFKQILYSKNIIYWLIYQFLVAKK